MPGCAGVTTSTDLAVGALLDRWHRRPEATQGRVGWRLRTTPWVCALLFGVACLVNMPAACSFVACPGLCLFVRVFAFLIVVAVLLLGVVVTWTPVLVCQLRSAIDVEAGVFQLCQWLHIVGQLLLLVVRGKVGCCTAWAREQPHLHPGLLLLPAETRWPPFVLPGQRCCPPCWHWHVIGWGALHADRATH